MAPAPIRGSARSGSPRRRAMTGSKAELLRFIELQRDDYRRGLPDKVARLRALLERLRHAVDAADVLLEVERLAHGLHGTGGTYGLR